RLYLDQRPIRARRPTIAYVARKLVRRHRALSAAAAALVVALGVAQYGALRYFQRGRELESTEGQKRFYLELGQKLAELNNLMELDEQAERFVQSEQPVEVLEEWMTRAERLVGLLDLRRAELNSMLNYQGRAPVEPGEAQLLLNTQTEIVNRLDQMI